MGLWSDASGGGTPVAAASFGSEDRIRVDPAQPAHSTLVVIEILDAQDDVLVVCSGTIVGDRAVLTAAHCLWDPEQPPAARARVIPGKDGSRQLWGSQTSTRWMVPDEFKSASFADQFRHDFAIVSLPDSEMTDRTGTVPGGIAVLTEEAFVNPSSRFAVAGYPYDCNDRVCGEAAFDSLYGLGDHAWLAPTTFAWASPNLVYHDADEFDGMSGGPLLRTSDMALAGIVSGTDPFLARSLKLTHPVVERLAQWCRQNGCSLDLARPSAAAPRPYRAVALAIATDSASGLCVTERSFLERLAAADEEFLPALAEFLQTMPEEDFDPGSPAWRAGFERAYGPLKPAADRMAALQPPNSRFEAYHHEVDEGLAEFMEGLELVKRAVDENSEDVFWEGVVLISTGADHFEDAAEVYPGVHSACLAPLGSPFALPPARR